MFIENISPAIFTLGPLVFRWYGLMMALSFMLGGYYFIKHGVRKGLDEEKLLAVLIIVILGGVLGARALYVLTNLPTFMGAPLEALRIDRGGLSFHGGLLGGLLGTWLYTQRYEINLRVLMDLAVPGLALGYMLVRIANIFNQEILGHPTTLFFFEQHPTQIYGSIIGLVSLLIHNYLARTLPARPGVLFWLFIFYYSLLRGIIEETFRANPLYLWGYVNEFWGVGFFTMTHLVTPFILLLAWRMIQKYKYEG